ncbi:hypothetical protein [Parabacteroides pacaensis]|uniref:hypothetical protein n=1 Tax=Parabacteroides pacaensis TaxID=2086575 RepID=UPI000D0FF0B9|nr:hypothetical protein [Parabacteroides pacaensis]
MEDKKSIAEELENYNRIQSELLSMIDTYSLHTCAWIHGSLNQIVEMLNDKMAEHYGEDK